MQSKSRRSRPRHAAPFTCELLDQRVMLSVSASNFPVTTQTGSAITVANSAVLGATTGSDHVVSYGSPTHGTVNNTASGVTYTPAAGFTGTDSFSYTAGGAYQSVLSLPIGTGSSPVLVSLDSYQFSDSVKDTKRPYDLQFAVDLSGITPALDQLAYSGAQIASGASLTIYQNGVAGLTYTFTNFSLSSSFEPASTVSANGTGTTVETLDATFTAAAMSTSTLTTPASSGPSYSLQFTDPTTNISYTLPLTNETMGLEKPTATTNAQFNQLNIADSGVTAAASELYSITTRNATIQLLTLTNYTVGGTVAAQYYFQLSTVTAFSTYSNGGSIPFDAVQFSITSLTGSIPVAGGANSIGRFNQATQNQSASVTTPLPPSGSLNATASTSTASTPEVITPTGSANSSLTIGALAVTDFQIQDHGLALVTIPIGGDTPAWLVSAGTGNLFSSITLTRKRTTGPAVGQFVYLTDTLQNAYVNTYTIRENVGGEEDLELAIEATSVTESYTPQNSDGSAGTAVVRTYNESTHASSSGGGSPSDTVAPATNTAVLSFLSSDGQTVSEQLVVSGYSFNPSSGTSGGTVNISAGLSSESPVLLQQASSGAAFSGNVALTVLTTSASQQLVNYTLGTVSVTSDSVDLDPTNSAPTEQFTLQFKTLQADYSLAAPNAVPAPNAQLVSYYLQGSTTPVTFAVNTSANSEYVSKNGATSIATFNPLDLDFNLTSAELALDNAYVASSVIPVIILTQYDATGAAAVTYTYQNCTIYSLTPAGGGGTTPTDSLSINYSAVTVDYLPASVATYNVTAKNTTALNTTPAAPTGSPTPGGSTPGVSNTSPLELTFATPSGTVAIGALAPTSFSMPTDTTPDMIVTVPLGTEEPALFYDEALQLPFTSATLVQRDARGNVLAQWTLTGNVVVANDSYNAPLGGLGTATETFLLRAVQVSLTAEPPLPGTGNGIVSDSFNSTTNTDSLTGTPTSSTTGNDTATGLIVVNVTSGSTLVLNNSNEYLRLDPNGSTLDVYNGTAALGTPSKYLLSNYSNIKVTPAFAGIGLLTVDESLGNPLASGGLNVDGSVAGVSESLQIDGTSGNDTATVTASSVALSPGGTIGYASITGIAFNGGAGADTIIQNAQPGGSATLAFINSTSNDSLTVNAGTYTFPAPTAGIAVYQLNNIAGAAGTTIALAGPTSHASRSLLIFHKYNLLGTLDLGGNDLEITEGTLPLPTTLVASGFNGGTWSGVGIKSSAAANDTTHLTALGVIQNNQSGTALYTSANPFDTTAPAAGDILIKYTYFGDANIDGRVDGSDYTLIDNGFNAHLTGWYNGDFNYDGKIDGSDYTLIDNAFNRQGAVLASAIVSASATVNSSGKSDEVATSPNHSAAHSNDWFSDHQKKPKHSFFR